MRRDLVGTLSGAALAVLLGAGVGIVTTFTHRQWPVAGVPLGLLAGIAIVAALLVGFRLAFPGRLTAAAAALGVVGAIVLLGMPTAGGDVLLVGDAVGWTWAVAPVLVAAVVVAWPASGARSGLPAARP